MVMPVFANLDLLIGHGPRGYRAHVIHSLAGEPQAIDFDQEKLQAILDLAGRWSSKLLDQSSVAAGEAVDLQDFGARLYHAAFAGGNGTCLLRSLDEARRRGAGLRIRLRFDKDLGELAELPWEYLHAGEPIGFLALSPETPVVRYLEMPEGAPPLQIRPPLTVLAVLAGPVDMMPLALDAELERLRGALADLVQRGLVRLEVLPEASLEALQDRLQRGPVPVLHFVGHGFFDASMNQGGLVFEDGAKRSRFVMAEALGQLFRGNTSMRLAFLNACEGARGGRSDPFAGVAQRLVASGIPAVVAMQFPISDGAARTLSQTFYRALVNGYPVDAALSEARKAVAVQQNSTEWGTPVLFSRSDDNRLIELPEGDRRPVLDTKPFEPETILIPGGPFLMGSDDPGASTAERPQHEVALPDFRIGKYPVTVSQYAAFIKDRKAQPAPQGWFNREPPAGRQDHPVTDVSWLDALAYCAWLSEQTGRRYTLPSEAEWEKAASWGPGDTETRGQGDKGKRGYPWGPAWIEGLCNAGNGGTMVVNAYPAGASVYGVEDLLGNVQEWTRSVWGSQPAQPDTSYPYDPVEGRADGREVTDPAKLPAQARLVHRGGSYKSLPAVLRCTARGNAPPDSRIAWRGFRVVMHLEEPA